MFGNAPEHTRADFFLIVKREYEICPTWTSQDAVGRAGLTFDRPADPQQSGQYQSRLG
jgi:hypothetical protein